jgi:bifunctional oligoribonuclease and PAP phosphatase NrnA
MKPHPKIIDKILGAIRDHQTFCIVGHTRPDGDCLGSQLGLTMALESQGKQVVCWIEDDVPEKLQFLDLVGRAKQPVEPLEFDCVIAVDCATYERLGTVLDFIKSRKVLINIDHHQSNTRYGDINWIAAREPATGELIFRLMKAAKWKITPDIANCLYTAISTDTGSFQYPTTRPSTYQAAADLVKRGANLDAICNEVYQSFPLSRVRLLRHVYNHFRLTHQNQIAYFWLKRDDYRRSGADPDESEGLIDHIRSIEPVIVACVFEEVEPNVIRISLRSKRDDVDVSVIAQMFEGGGHKASAGARIQGTPLSVQRKVVQALRRALDHAQSQCENSEDTSKTSKKSSR